MKTLITVLLGIVSSIFLHGNWLFIDNQTWTRLLIESNLFMYVGKNHHEGWGYALISSWFILPLLLPITVFLTLIVNTLDKNRLFIYMLLLTSTFMFTILPKLPAFDIVLSGLDNFMNIIIE